MTLAFTAESEEKFQGLLGRYPNRQAALIPALVIANREFGYLSREVMEYVAERLDLPRTYVLNTATFYTLLHKQPVGRYHIQVCVNVSCYLNGADHIADRLKRKLGIGFGEVTDDGLFSLEGVQCLASCDTAPVIQVNDDYHENMTPDRVDQFIDSLRQSGGGQ